MWDWEVWLKVVIFSLMIFAISKPFIYDTSTNQDKKGRDLILALDASGSMGQSGFDENDRFKNRFEITLELSQAFIKERFDDNMGVVIFGTFAYTTSPLTYDLASLSYLLSLTNVGIAGESTAIGDAIMQSIRTLSYGNAKNKVIILLSDGYHNAGKTSPQIAVEKAKELGIKIYTIGVGKKMDYDVALLQRIAKETNAKSYSAITSTQLSKIYEDINSLEPSPIRSESFLNQKLQIIYPLLAIIILLLLWIFRSEK
ncbi:BatA (Bacteroides aerotolerance operon) [hydrothermal vent metagenome]|uniref:BatA (Bacteroides aerotolerance operon) n=1 Tax=hydrothermal vent metagenome TaxID=652676 RepID=A0A1W1EIG6_9ZZZZ